MFVAVKVFVATNDCRLDFLVVREELRDILRDAYLRERKLNLLYATLTDHDAAAAPEFFARAIANQDGDLQVLQKINQRYGNEEIDPSVMEKLGEGILNLRAARKERDDLLRQVLDWETELVEIYKGSLRFLHSDDETRKLINRIITVKLGHRRELMDQLKMF